MIKKLLLTLGVIILFTSVAFSQQNSTLQGTVVNQLGEPQGYSRVLLQKEGKTVNMTMANDKGEYQLFGVEPGTYDMVAEAQMTCQKSTKLTNVQVAAGKTVFVNFEIDCSNEIGEVVITWEPPVFDPDNTSSTTRISSENLKTTPGRSVSSALANLEGVQSDGNGGMGFVVVTVPTVSKPSSMVCVFVVAAVSLWHPSRRLSSSRAVSPPSMVTVPPLRSLPPNRPRRTSTALLS